MSVITSVQKHLSVEKTRNAKTGIQKRPVSARADTSPCRATLRTVKHDAEVPVTINLPERTVWRLQFMHQNPQLLLLLFACAKLVRTPALIRAGSRVAYRPISAAVLSRPEARTGEGSTVFNGAQNGACQLIRREFQTSVISRDIDTAAKFIGAGAATKLVYLTGSPRLDLGLNAQHHRSYGNVCAFLPRDCEPNSGSVFQGRDIEGSQNQ
ncbi:hypothetical protein U0070_014273 [Myodes glareolus]|uniref:Uncharacterized protein n=1 Tax=Myodes glareolus TaxID=447135 RepID=A0AAW0I268_MYOGA